MKSAIHALLLALLGLALSPAHAAGELDIERLATCQDSWLDWKNDPARGAKMGESLRANYVQKESDNGRYFAPKTPKTLLGFPLTQLYPDSIGMAVGFSAVVSGSFDATRRSVEKIAGKPLKDCESGEGMKTCQLELAPKKTILILGTGKGDKTTLVGCAYYYEK